MIPEELNEELLAMAKLKMSSQAFIIRTALREFFDKEERENGSKSNRATK